MEVDETETYALNKTYNVDIFLTVNWLNFDMVA